jgi:hypothetical protein
MATGMIGTSWNHENQNWRNHGETHVRMSQNMKHDWVDTKKTIKQ